MIKVGDKVIVRWGKITRSGTVSKIGRKWFTVEFGTDGLSSRFHIETRQDDSPYSHGVARTAEEWDLLDRRQEAVAGIRRLTEYGDRRLKNCPVENLEKALSLLQEGQDATPSA